MLGATVAVFWYEARSIVINVLRSVPRRTGTSRIGLVAATPVPSAGNL
jgi:hypothetical protein